VIVEFEWQPSVSPVQLSTEQLRTSLSLLVRVPEILIIPFPEILITPVPEILTVWS